jgi:hypothetical protein
MSTRLLLVSTLLLVAPAVAAADPGDHPHPHVHENPRLGFFGGFGLAAGEISCEGNGCDGVREAGGVEGHVGYAFNDKLALIGEVWAMENREDDITLTYINTSVGARYWLAPIIWVQAGIGSGHARVKYTGIIDIEGRSDNIATLMLGAGIEVIRSKRWAMDVELKFAQGANEDADGDEVTTGRMTGLGVGFTWF